MLQMKSRYLMLGGAVLASPSGMAHYLWSVYRFEVMKNANGQTRGFRCPTHFLLMPVQAPS